MTSYIGKNVLRVDAPAKVTGEAIFSSDIKPHGMLYGKCKRSPHPLAHILSVDIGSALKLPGVRAIITARNVKQSYCGEYLFDQLPLCDQYSYYIGDEVAAVAAIDEETAQEAIDLIKVNYEVLTPVLDLEKATELGAPAVHPELESIKQNIAYQVDFERGEVTAAFQQADLVFEERFTTSPVHQCYLQPRDCVAAWDGDRLTLWAAMQGPFEWRKEIANGVCIPESHVRVIPCYVGGGFGDNASRIWPIAALLARQAGHPVKLAFTREEEFTSGRPFTSAVVKMKMGFKKDGTLLVQSKDIILDAGAYMGIGFAIATVAAGRVDNMYRVPNVKTSARLVYTNTTPRGALRGFGTQIMTFVIESMMDMAAERLGLDPKEIRLKNASQKGDTSVHGFIFNSCGLSESIKLAAEESNFKEKRRERYQNYGIGMATTIHVAGNRTIIPVYDGSAAIVSIDDTGTARIISGETDIGQGANTVFAQIGAEELGMDIKDIIILPVDTAVSPFSKGTYASRVTVLGGYAVRLAAQDAKRQLLAQAAEVLNSSEDKLELRNSQFYVKGSDEVLVPLAEVARQVVIKRCGLPVIGQGSYTVPDYVTKAGKEQQYYGNYSVAYTFVTEVAEVSVDTESGEITVSNIWAVVDIGKMINPKMCEAQVEGGVVMGVGYALNEHYIVDQGKVLNAGFRDYKLPTFSRAPQIHSFFVETVDPGTLYGAKSIGEAVTNPTAPAIANAIYNAIGVRIKDLPITPEKILKALKEKL
ncbi:4-hydroxybenzoyl-CoA reductase subunit alpha [subsurface metagenome]